MIVVSNQLVGAPVGTDVSIDCHVETYPRAINYWIFNDGMLLSANKHSTEVLENGYTTRMKLTVKNLQLDDFGAYRCVSKNSLGDTEGTIRLYGEYEFDFLNINNMRISTDLVCYWKLCAQPVKFVLKVA